MSEIQKLLERIRKEARQRTLERISKAGRNVNIIFFTIISEIYSLEALLEELLLTLDELNKKFNKKQK